jgi:DNA polymerase-3 subunit beta
MLGIPPEDFPVIPPPDASGIVMLARTDLLRVMGYCAPCVSADVTRFALCGVLLELDPAPDDPAHAVRAQATATDGHRLAHIAQTCPVPDALREPLRAILHRRGVEEIRRVGGAGDCDTIGIGRHEGSIVFYCGASLLIVKAIEDEFPEYQKIIPEAPPTLVNVGSADIEAVLKTAASVTSAKVALVKLTADPDGKLTFFGSNPDSGDATATCDADVKGPTATIGLNARFVAEALDACDAADVRLGLTDDASPVVFRAFEDDGALTVVMPMRI